MNGWLTGVLTLVVLAHMGGALSWGVVNKRSGFETLALVAFVSVAWPLFALRMLCRGYRTFLLDGWPKGFWE